MRANHLNRLLPTRVFRRCLLALPAIAICGLFAFIGVKFFIYPSGTPAPDPQIKVWTDEKTVPVDADAGKRPDQQGNVRLSRTIYFSVKGEAYFQWHYEAFTDPSNGFPRVTGQWGDLFFGITGDRSRNGLYVGGWNPHQVMRPHFQQGDRQIALLPTARLASAIALESGTRGMAAFLWEMPEAKARFLLKLAMFADDPNWFYMRLSWEGNWQPTGFEMGCSPVYGGYDFKTKEQRWATAEQVYPGTNQQKPVEITEGNRAFAFYNQYEFENGAALLVLAPEDWRTIRPIGGKGAGSFLVYLAPKDGARPARLAMTSISGAHHRDIIARFFGKAADAGTENDFRLRPFNAERVFTRLQDLDWRADMMTGIDVEALRKEIERIFLIEALRMMFSERHSALYAKAKTAAEALRSGKELSDFEEADYAVALRQYREFHETVVAEAFKHPEIIKSIENSILPQKGTKFTK